MRGVKSQNSAIAEFETADSLENTAFSAIILLTLRVSTFRSTNRLVPCRSSDLTVYPKIQRGSWEIWCLDKRGGDL